MKQKQLPKSAFFLLLALSIGAFLYVNADDYRSAQQSSTARPLVESAIESDNYAEEDTRKVPVPAISVLSKIFEIAQKFASVAPR